MTGIAVAVATVNRPASLGRCLDALLSGRTLPAEIVVVDQGESDATRAIIEERGSYTVRLVRVVGSRQGLAASRNSALAETTASVLAVTDDDCVPAPEWVDVLARAFDAPDAPDAVTGRVLPLGPEVPGWHAVSSRPSTVRTEFEGRAMPWDVGTGANLAVRRDWLERVGPYDERLGVGTRGYAGEDMDMLYRLLRAGARIRYEPDALVYHERQPAAHRSGSRFGYGAGVGAACAFGLRRRDSYALVILGRWLAMRGRVLGGGVRRRRWPMVRDELTVLAGTVRGLSYGAGARRRPS